LKELEQQLEHSIKQKERLTQRNTLLGTQLQTYWEALQRTMKMSSSDELYRDHGVSPEEVRVRNVPVTRRNLETRNSVSSASSTYPPVLIDTVVTASDAPYSQHVPVPAELTPAVTPAILDENESNYVDAGSDRSVTPTPLHPEAESTPAQHRRTHRQTKRQMVNIGPQPTLDPSHQHQAVRNNPPKAIQLTSFEGLPHPIHHPRPIMPHPQHAPDPVSHHMNPDMQRSVPGLELSMLNAYHHNSQYHHYHVPNGPFSNTDAHRLMFQGQPGHFDSDGLQMHHDLGYFDGFLNAS
jgi:hypothetical protein